MAKSGTIKIYERKLKDGSTSLWLDISQRGKRLQCRIPNLRLTGDEALDAFTRLEAEKHRAALYVELVNNRLELGRTLVQSNEFLDYFRRDQARQISSTQLSYRSPLRKLERFLPPRIALKDVTPELMDEFTQSLLREGLQRNTIATYIAIIRAVLERARRSGLITANPLDNVEKVKKSLPPRSYLTADELRKIANARSPVGTVRHHIETAFLFSCFACGVRYSDLAQLRWRDISERGDTFELVQQKTREHLVNPLTDSARAFLPPRGKDDELVFNLVTAKGNQRAANKAMIEWKKRSGIRKHLHFHMSRHTFAFLFLDSVADIYTLSKLLGHNSIKTTEIYAHLVTRRKSEAMEMMPKL